MQMILLKKQIQTRKNKISEKYTALTKEFNSTLADTAADVKCNYSEYATDLAKS